MNNKYLYLITLTLLEVILQLAFFWLAPMVPCYWTVYIMGSVMTIIHIGVIFVVGTKYGIRRSTATIVAGSVCQMILVVACAVLLGCGSSIRSSIFLLLIVAMLYTVIVTLLILAIEKNDMLDSHTGNLLNARTQKQLNGAYNEVMLDHAVHSVQRPIPTVDTVPITQTVSGVNMATNNGSTPPPLPMRR